MKLKFKATFSTAIAISFGMIVLLGYFFGSDAAGRPTMLGVVRDYFLKGAVVLAAVAMLVGIANLTSVHWRKIKTGKNEGYSFVLLLSLMLTLGVGIYEISGIYLRGEPNFQKTLWIFDNIQLPIETSLMAVLTVSLTYAAARLLGRRMTVFSAVFVGIVLVLLLGAVPQFASISAFSWLRTWVVDVWAVGGARGILLGVALGTIATGIRILMGSDRPYGG
ncbi:MAG: hypothetical protein KKD28_11715 [Chloroflexi bacterium]|nr:hypothetical protein [Chloroflexota bacterium]MBU1662125.1 hypothetical protein [Chloroflexota bacterium]